MDKNARIGFVRIIILSIVAIFVSVNLSAQLGVTLIEDVPVYCNGGSATISVSVTGGTQSGLEYSLNNIDWQSSNIFNLPAGAVTIYVHDDGANIDNESFTITEPAVLSYSLPDPLYFCGAGNGQITVTPSGGTPDYIVEVTGDVSGSKGQQVISSGSAVYATLDEENFTITVSDANGCNATPQVVGLFEDDVAPSLIDVPVDFHMQRAIYNAGNSAIPVERLNTSIGILASVTSTSYDYPIDNTNYSNVLLELSVSQVDGTTGWENDDSISVHVSYDGATFIPLWIDKCQWNASNDPVGEYTGSPIAGSPDPAIKATIDLGDGADLNPNFMFRIYVNVDGVGLRYNISQVRVIADERIHTIPQSTSGWAPSCDDGTGSGCNGAVQVSDGAPNWLCSDVGAEEFSFVRTFSAVDFCSNPISAVQNIYVGTDPVIGTPADTTLDFCNNSATIISPSFSDGCDGSPTLEWEVTTNGGFAGSSGIGTNPTINFPQPVLNDTTYVITWTVTDHLGFTATATQNVVIKRPIQVSLVADAGSDNFCSGESASFTISFSGGTGAYDGVDPVITPAGSWVWNTAVSGTFTTNLLNPGTQEISVIASDQTSGVIEGGCDSDQTYFGSDDFLVHELIQTQTIRKD